MDAKPGKRVQSVLQGCQQERSQHLEHTVPRGVVNSRYPATAYAVHSTRTHLVSRLGILWMFCLAPTCADVV